jgi:hypothetical protein
MKTCAEILLIYFFGIEVRTGLDFENVSKLYYVAYMLSMYVISQQYYIDVHIF